MFGSPSIRNLTNLNQINSDMNNIIQYLFTNSCGCEHSDGMGGVSLQGQQAYCSVTFLCMHLICLHMYIRGSFQLVQYHLKRALQLSSKYSDYFCTVECRLFLLPIQSVYGSLSVTICFFQAEFVRQIKFTQKVRSFRKLIYISELTWYVYKF